MAKRFMIFVIDDLSGSGTPEEMATINAFNDELRAHGQWIFAGGLSSPESGNVIDNRSDANISTGKPFIEALENYSGFWLIEAADSETAQKLAFAGSKACNRKVELRPLLG
ncbi:MAG: YciI family protein [Actinobacteria bacterium]|nr:YciI family protein [Actinomycetota bacterium]